MKYNPFFIWSVWFIYFGIFEGIGIYREVVRHQNDSWTLTHFIAVTIPIGMRVALLAWLAYHFIWEHKNF